MAKDIQNRCNQNTFNKKGTLVLLKRNFDLITPLMQDWHYHSMINDCIGVTNNTIKIGNKSKEFNGNQIEV